MHHTRADLVQDYVDAFEIMELTGASISDGKTFGIAASLLRNTLRERDRYFAEMVRLRELLANTPNGTKP